MGAGGGCRERGSGQRSTGGKKNNRKGEAERRGGAGGRGGSKWQKECEMHWKRGVTDTRDGRVPKEWLT